MSPHDFARWSGWNLDAGEAGQALAGWSLIPIVVNGKERGGAILRGTEIHVALSPEWRGRTITRARAREFLEPLMAGFGFLTTRAIAGAGHHRFLSGIGFKKTWSGGGVDHYMLSEAPLGRTRSS